MSTAGHGGKVIVPTQRQQRLQEIFRKRIDDEAASAPATRGVGVLTGCPAQVTNLVESFMGIVKCAQVGSPGSKGDAALCSVR